MRFATLLTVVSGTPASGRFRSLYEIPAQAKLTPAGQTTAYTVSVLSMRFSSQKEIIIRHLRRYVSVLSMRFLNVIYDREDGKFKGIWFPFSL